MKNKFIYQLIISATQVMVPLITYPYITRVLGPGNLGKVNYVDFIAQLFIMFAAFGIPFYAVREIAYVRHDTVKRSKLIQELTILHGLFTLLAIAFFVILTFKQWQQNLSLYFFAIINILLSAFSFEWYVQGMEDFHFAAIRTLFVRICMIAGFFVFVKNANDYSTYYGIFTAGVFCIASFNWYKIIVENKIKIQPLYFKKHLKPLWHFFLTASAISIYIYFETILLHYFTQNEVAVGYYTTTIKIVKIFLVGLLAIGTVMMPRLSYLVNNGSIVEIKRYLDQLLHFIITIGLPVSTGLLLLAPEIIYVVAGEKFTPAVPTMRILSLLPLLIGLSNIFCFQTLVPFKKESKFLIVVIIGSITSVLLNIILIPVLEERGAAIANLITEFFITIVAGYYAHKIIPFAPKLSLVLQSIFACLLFIPVVFFCKTFLVNQLAILLSSIFICMILYYCVQLFIFKNTVLKEIHSFAKNLLPKIK